MKGALLDKEQTPAAAAAVAAAAAAHSLGSAFQFVLAVVYAAFILYVTGIYTHSWAERLQMLPLCIVAVTAPVVWAIMFRIKYHG